MKHAIILAAVLAMAVSVVYAQQETSVPPLINYQGMLADANGNPMTGTKKLTFNIYDAAIGGNLVWGPQVFDSVPLINGRFNVILGTTDNNGKLITDAFDAKERYLGITVDSNSEIAPRQQILSAPFAIHAETAEHAETAKSAEASEKLTIPDYDSGWFQIAKNKTYEGLKHNMGELPILIVGWKAKDNQGSNLTASFGRIFTDGSNSWGFGIKNITTTSYDIVTGSHCACNNTLGCQFCYIRVLMWK